MLNSYQIGVIRTLWELAQGRIDGLYTVQSAEQEKQSMEKWFIRVFPDDWMEFVRAESPVGYDAIKMKVE